MVGKKQTSLTNAPKRIPPRLEEERITRERMRDILLLLENLFKREEATAKIILNCLYEVGSINLINQKIPFQPLNGLMKSIAAMSQPVFGIFALRWFQKNCPKLIADWLEEQVTFKEEGEEVAPQVREVKEERVLLGENFSQEIKSLRAQVRLLTGILAIAIVYSLLTSLT